MIRLKLLVTCKQWLLFGVGLGLLLFWDPAQAIELDLESERLETMIEERAARHKIMLGRLKKISNNLDPKSEQLVQGIRHYETFRAASGVSLDEAMTALKSAVASEYTTRFVCQGRDCGSSNEWANAVFDEPKLYGLEQSQYYWVGQNRQTSDYWLVYISKRSNKPVHYRVEWFEAGQANWGEKIEQGFEQQGFVRFGLKEAQSDLISLKEALNIWCQAHNLTLIAVAVSDDERGISPQRNLRASQKIAENLASTLQDARSGCQYTAHGLGSLAPIEGWTGSRIDLIVQGPYRALEGD